MAVYFFDTSALIKYYHEEVGRQRIVSLTEEATNTIRISRLSYVEWHSAFAQHVRMGLTSTEELRLLQSRFHADLRSRKFRIVPVQAFHFQRATRLLTTHAPTRNLRTLDALQLAVALDLHRRLPLDGFVCADAALCDIARQEDLAVVNPEAV